MGGVGTGADVPSPKFQISVTGPSGSLEAPPSKLHAMPWQETEKAAVGRWLTRVTWTLLVVVDVSPRLLVTVSRAV